MPVPLSATMHFENESSCTLRTLSTPCPLEDLALAPTAEMSSAASRFCFFARNSSPIQSVFARNPLACTLMKCMTEGVSDHDEHGGGSGNWWFGGGSRRARRRRGDAAFPG